MSEDETKYHRLWSVANKNCLVLTVPKNGNELTITCKNSDREDGPEESSKLQLRIMMNSFLSLVV